MPQFTTLNAFVIVLAQPKAINTISTQPLKMAKIIKCASPTPIAQLVFLNQAILILMLETQPVSAIGDLLNP